MTSEAPVDLLMITWNRRAYVEKTLARLLSDPADFRLYWWDNGSTDGVAELMSQVRDERIVQTHRCPTNAMQGLPTQWFLEQAQSDVVGKLDDDTLAPPGWTQQLATAVRKHERLGMIGCWTFWPEDFERNRTAAERRMVRIGEHRIVQAAIIGGTGVLLRRDLAERYRDRSPNGRKFAIDRMALTLDGYISGWYFPLLWAEHMDDPRSEHCLMRRSEGLNGQAALTAKLRGFTDVQQYLGWIRADADQAMRQSVSAQVRRWRRQQSLLTRVVHRTKASLRGLF